MPSGCSYRASGTGHDCAVFGRPGGPGDNRLAGVECANASAAGGPDHARYLSRHLGHPGPDDRPGAGCGAARPRLVRGRPAGHRGDPAHPGGDCRDRRDRAANCRRSRSAPAPCSAPPMSPPRCMPARAFWSAPAPPRNSPPSALATELPYLPGVATPSEIMAARALGVCFMKFFPAEALGGAAFLRALAPVFPGVAFCPTGGIDERLAAEYLGAAQRADGRRLVDGAEGRDPGRRLGPDPPARRARRRDRPGRGGLIGDGSPCAALPGHHRAARHGTGVNSRRTASRSYQGGGGGSRRHSSAAAAVAGGPAAWPARRARRRAAAPFLLGLPRRPVPVGAVFCRARFCRGAHRPLRRRIGS